MRTTGTIGFGIAVAVVAMLVAAPSDALAGKKSRRARKDAKVAEPAPAPRLLSDTLPMDDLVIAPAPAAPSAAPSGSPATPAPAAPKPATPKQAKKSAKPALDHAAAGSFDLTRSRDVAKPSGDDVLKMPATSLQQPQITAVVKANLAQLQFCYERAASGDPDATGEVTLRFSVSPKGKVSGITITAGGVTASKLEGCIKRNVARWKFPAADAPTEVDYPLVFDLAGAPR
jgi:hypothetical protein